MKSFHAAITNFLQLTIVLSAGTVLGQSSDNSTAVVTYDQVQPVLKKHCISCHGIERERGDLDLSSTDGIKAGSSSGPVVVPGKPEESLLYSLSAHLESPRMPPGKAKIPQRELDLIRNWIDGGLREKPAKASVAAKTAVKPMPAAGAPIQPVAPKSSIHVLPRPTAVTALAVSPKDGSVAVSGLREILIFPRAGSAKPNAIPFSEGDLYALRYSRDGEWLVAGGGIGAESGKVVVFDAMTGRRLFEVGDEKDIVLALDVSPDRSLIALGGPGRTVKIFRTADQQLAHTLQKHTDWILSVGFSPDGLLLASGDRFGGLQVWEAVTGKPFSSLRGHTGPVNSVAWGTTSDQLLSAGQDGFVRLWDMHQGLVLKSWNAEIGGIICAEWTKAGTIAVGSRQKQVAIFDASGNRLRGWAMADEVVELATSSDGGFLIAGDAAGNLEARLIATGETAGTFVIPVSSQDGQAESQQVASSTAAPSVLLRKPRVRPTNSMSTDLDLNKASSHESAAQQSGSEQRLQQAREALLSTEAAVRATEESLARLKASAAALRKIVGDDESRASKSSNTSPSQ